MYALRAGRLFDGHGLVADPTVVIDGDRVHSIGEPVPEGVQVDDLGTGVTLLPGLVDTHQHLCFNGLGTLEEQVSPYGDDELLERAAESGRRALAGGVTTLRDLGDRGFVTLGLRDQPDQPTILAAGPPLTRPDGHCWYLGGGYGDLPALRAAVADRVERGVDVVKIMVTGGVLTSGRYPIWTTQFPADEVRAIVEAAHAAGLPVAAHCHGVVGIAMAIDCGVDSIEHCTFLGEDSAVHADDALIERLARSGVTVSATLGRVPGRPEPEFIERIRPALFGVLRRLIEGGAAVVAGSDAGIVPDKPHDVLPHALADFAAIGISPVEGLRAMTSTAARSCGVGDRKGLLAAGHDADVVAVLGDPTTDPGALTSVHAVWKAGRPVAR